MDERISPSNHQPIKDFIMQFIKNFIQEEDGVTAIEYALIAALIAGVIFGVVQTLGGNIKSVFTKIQTSFAPIAK
jgi:pilus assembly protein Flp/PilA